MRFFIAELARTRPKGTAAVFRSPEALASMLLDTRLLPPRRVLCLRPPLSGPLQLPPPRLACFLECFFESLRPPWCIEGQLPPPRLACFLECFLECLREYAIISYTKIKNLSIRKKVYFPFYAQVLQILRALIESL